MQYKAICSILVQFLGAQLRTRTNLIMDYNIFATLLLVIQVAFFYDISRESSLKVPFPVYALQIQPL